MRGLFNWGRAYFFVVRLIIPMVAEYSSVFMWLISQLYPGIPFLNPAVAGSIFNGLILLFLFGSQQRIAYILNKAKIIPFLSNWLLCKNIIIFKWLVNIQIYRVNIKDVNPDSECRKILHFGKIFIISG